MFVILAPFFSGRTPVIFFLFVKMVIAEHFFQAAD